jgi:hypothetical protein
MGNYKMFCKTVIFYTLFQFFAVVATVQAEPPIWGLDSRLSILEDDAVFIQLLDRSLNSNIKWYREPVIRQADALTRQQLEQMASRGCNILSMFPWKSRKVLSLHAGNLNTELNEVYLQARALARQNQSLIHAWELGNEPDTSFITALPDQYAAWAKAVYLGLKAGTPESHVISGGMGLPPGNYLDQLAENGALWYADAFNQHYYGHSEHFTSMFQLLDEKLTTYAQQGLCPEKILPVWVTECGYRTSPSDQDIYSTYQRQRQANEIRNYAKAASSSRIALFMPYCLHHHYSFSLWDIAAEKPFDAWNEYTEQTKQTQSTAPAGIPENEKLFHSPSINPPTVVAQWRPNLTQCRPHKLSATYQFLADTHSDTLSMSGIIRVYNFSSQVQSGSLNLTLPATLKSSVSSTSITVSPNSYQDVPISLTSAESGYFRAPVAVHFSSNQSKDPASLLFFQLESPHVIEDFTPVTIKGRLPLTRLGRILSFLPFFQQPQKHHQFSFVDRSENLQITSYCGPWLGINQVLVEAPPDHPTARNSQSLNIPWHFTLSSNETQLNSPPTVVTRISGLPSSGFLRVRTPRPMEHGFAVRIDLIDVHQRRFSQFEWYGLVRGKLNRELWLNMADFHPFGWGNFKSAPFNPAEVREIQLRLFFGRSNVPVPFQLDFLRNKLEK